MQNDTIMVQHLNSITSAIARIGQNYRGILMSWPLTTNSPSTIHVSNTIKTSRDPYQRRHGTWNLACTQSQTTISMWPVRPPSAVRNF